MDKYVIRGGRKISGKIKIERAKNAVLPLLAASILTDEEVVIKDCPKIIDVMNMIKILQALGVKVTFDDRNVIVNAKGLNSSVVMGEEVKELRSSIFLMGSLLAKCKEVKIGFPGGCNIGDRPIDLHIKALNKLGAKTVVVDDGVECVANKITGKKIKLDFPSVGATENAMLCAVLAEGKTEIHNSAREPEIVDLMNFLNSMGAKVFGAGTSTILIEGVKKLNGTTYMPMEDRIEAGTYMLASAITGGELEISGIKAKNICSLIHKLCDNTCKIAVKNDIIYMRSNGRGKSFNLHTGPYPDFPTDLQSQMAVLASVASGSSTITENVFERRFAYVDELNKMGADIRVKGRTAYVNGVLQLTGTKVRALDLRGGAALIIAGLNAEGITQVSGAEHVLRGYLDLDKKFRSLGADIKLVDGD